MLSSCIIITAEPLVNLLTFPLAPGAEVEAAQSGHLRRPGVMQRQVQILGVQAREPKGRRGPLPLG